jgi:outer membrane protein assembly factor BamB
VLALAGAGAGTVVALREDESPFACGDVSVAREQGVLRELVPRDELTPSGSVAATRLPTVTAFEELDPPFGPVVAGRFLKQGQSAPALLPLGDRLGLVSGSVLRVLDLPSGEVAWSLRLSAPLASGGLVGDHVSLLTGGPSPTVVTVAADDGEPESCAEVPLTGTPTGQPPDSLVTDQAGPDVVVAAARTASPVTLSRLVVLPAEEREEAGAWTAWEQELTGVTEVDDVRVVGDDVVVSQVADPVRLSEIALAGGITRPLVTAYDAADGEPTWNHPVGAGDRAATVVAEEAGSGTVFVLEVSPTGDGRETRSRLVALDSEGGVRWTRPLGTGLTSGSGWGDLVVVQGPGPDGGARVRAFTPEGARAWSLATPDLPFGEQRDNFGSATTVGEELVVPSPNGLVAIAPDTGDPRPLNVREQVDDLAVVGQHLVVRSGPAVLVMELQAGDLRPT